MAHNNNNLKEKVLFITGASRGIGLEIAKRAAMDGAWIVIAAKTDTPHPKLPGTIYTAAKEIEQLGGRALPVIVDVRDEQSIQKAVDKTIEVFGKIDILINNASAISLTNTENTSIKKYDLMHQINGRGTFICSQLCLPHLLKSSNPHILNISPPLDLSPRNFSNHVAYSVAKFNMSLFALGMADELERLNVKVNCLWPLHAVASSATQMLGSDDLVQSSRKPTVMSDAAYLILTSNATGKFFIDEDLLMFELGLNKKQMDEKYSMVPGNQLSPDFFIPEKRFIPKL